MYGTSGYYMGGQGFQPIAASAQGAPINIASGAASRYRPEPQSASLLPNAPGTTVGGQFQQAPSWIQDYVQRKAIPQNQVGSYDPALQYRDIYQGLSPQIQQLLGQYGAKRFSNPNFSQDGSRYESAFSQGRLDPFAWAGMEGRLDPRIEDLYKISGSHTTQRNDDISGYDFYIDPWTGQRVKTSAWGYR